jgi:hypothetical protein
MFESCIPEIFPGAGLGPHKTRTDFADSADWHEYLRTLLSIKAAYEELLQHILKIDYYSLRDTYMNNMIIETEERIIPRVSLMRSYIDDNSDIDYDDAEKELYENASASTIENYLIAHKSYIAQSKEYDIIKSKMYEFCTNYCVV